MKERLPSIMLLLGLCFIVSPASYSQEVFEESRNVYTTRELDKSLSMAKGNKVVIRSAATLEGSLAVVTGESNDVAIAYFKKANTDSRSKARDYIDLIAVQLSQAPEGIRVDLRAPNPAPWEDDESGFVEARLTVPKESLVEIKAQYFDVSVTGPVKSVTAPSSMGKFILRNVTHAVDIKTVNQRVLLENISGEINVSTSNALLAAKDITATAKQATFRNDGGDIEITGCTGELNITNSYGRIKVRKFTPTPVRSIIRNFSGPIELSLTSLEKGQLIVNNRYEDIEINIPPTISARLSLAVEEGGKINVGSFPFQTDLVQPNRLNLVAGEGVALISAAIRGKGNIYIRAEEEGE